MRDEAAHEWGTRRSEEMRRFFPFAMLRVRMTLQSVLS
jgi:hypothetical protein